MTPAYGFRPYAVGHDVADRPALVPGDRVALFRFDTLSGEVLVDGGDFIFGDVVTIRHAVTAPHLRHVIWEGGERGEVVAYPDKYGYHAVHGKPGTYAVHTKRPPTGSYPEGWVFGARRPKGGL